MIKKKFIILGAGPIGLVSALFLSLKKENVEIYEMKNIVGGMCRSWKWNDFILDTGPHIFHTHDMNLWKYWKTLFKDNLIKGIYKSKNVIGENFDKLIDYPLSETALKNLDSKLKKKIFQELKIAKKEKKKSATNFKQHVINQVGPTLQKMFYEDYPEKVWGMKTSDMTAEWAPKRIIFTKDSIPFFNKEITGVGKFGTGHLYEMIKKKISQNGGQFFLNHKVEKISHKENDIISINFSNKNKVFLNPDDVIISSLPITLTAKLLGYNSDLKFRGVRSVYVALNKKKCFKKKINWLYFSNKHIIFNRVSEPKTMSEHLAPKDKTYLCVEIAYSKKDQIDLMSFNELKKRVVDDLQKVKLIDIKDVIDVSENKEDFVYPVQFTNYRKLLEETKSNISKFPQIYSLGTGGDYDYADSQILFHKAIDLVKILTEKNSSSSNLKKANLNIKLNTEVILDGTTVGDANPPYIIAEAGLNHNGDLNIAKKLIDSAKEIGCNAIKFQTYEKNSRVSAKIKSINYVEKADGLREDLNEMFNRLSLDENFHKKIFNHAKKKKITIFSTPFNERSVDLLEKLNVPFYKVASVDAVNLPLIKKIGNTNKPLILSTGMCDISNVFDAVETFKKTGNKNLILLHCLSSYPANETEMNLNSIITMSKAFNIPVGFSDHYPGNEISILALATGAKVIEKHFTLDKNFEGPDHNLSANVPEMKSLVNLSNKIEQILGSGEKIIQPSEYFVINSQRKSVYAKINLKKNMIIKRKHISIKGPGGGLLPKYLPLILGKKIKKTILQDYPITWDSF
jgi:sialic acid synthase SpsE/protoporphyrinogen oxidase